METNPNVLKDHEFLISFHVDENSITQKAEEACVRAVEREFNENYKHSPTWGYEDSRLYQMVKEAVKNIVDENKQLIIDKSIENITKRICARKDFKKKCGEIKGEELDGNK